MVRKKGWSKWEKVDETPFQDKANEIVKELIEDDKIDRVKSEYDIKMIYGKIKDPMRPLFEVWKRKKLNKVI